MPWTITQQSSLVVCFATSSPVSFTACLSLLSRFMVAKRVCSSCVVKRYSSSNALSLCCIVPVYLYYDGSTSVVALWKVQELGREEHQDNLKQSKKETQIQESRPPALLSQIQSHHSRLRTRIPVPSSKAAAAMTFAPHCPEASISTFESLVQ